MKIKMELLVGYVILIGITGIISLIHDASLPRGLNGYESDWIFGFGYGAIYGAIFGGIFFTVYWYYHKNQNLILK